MKLRTNKYLSRMIRAAEAENTADAVEALTKDKRGASGSLESLAKNLGVTEIIEEDMALEGGLFQDPRKGLIIKLNIRSPAPRKRFTLAHEIGHLLLGAIPGHRNASCADPILEDACDSIAAELLMPSQEAMSFVRQLGSPSPENLRTIASKYQISLQSAAIRLHWDFGVWKCYIGMWDRNPQIKTAWFVGRRLWDRTEPDSYSLDLALSSPSEVESTEYWHRGPSAQPVWLKLLRTGNDRVLGLIGFVN